MAFNKQLFVTSLLLLAVLLSQVATAKVTVHLVPHTHDDIGWLKTVDEYLYGLNLTIQQADVNGLIGSAIGGLLEDPARRFTYVEIGFFSRWWDQQSDAMKVNVRQLVGEGRLQFANGGWCMHDEAATHFLDMIDQTTIGHRFLKREVNAVPKVGWQVDPFGHSATQASLLSARAGFLGTYHARIDYQDYNLRTQEKTREFWWRASPSMPDQVVFGEVLLHTTYCSPPGFTWDIVDVVPELLEDQKTHFIVDNPRSPQYNVPEVLERFYKQASEDAAVTRGENVMWTMGCDFNYLAGQLWFENIDKLIKIVNADGKMEAKYSTPYDYTIAKMSENVTFVEKLGDFFPYADGPHQFWTGYFTSRATLKRYVRQLSSYWTATRQFELFGLIPTGELPRMSDALGIAQHHDAVAGTAKQHVAFDYAKRLHEGYVEDVQRVVNSTAVIFGEGAAAGLSHCPLSNISVCAATAALDSSNNVSVLVWNPNAHDAASLLVEIPVPTLTAVASGPNVVAYTVLESSSPVTNYQESNADALPYTIAVQLGGVPAVGYVSFVLSVSASAETGARKKKVDSAADTLVVTTSDLVVTFSTVTGLLQSIRRVSQGVTVNITQDWCTFASNVGDSLSGQAGGAYIFRPVTNTTCTSILDGSTPVTIALVAHSENYFVVEQSYGYVTQRLIGYNDVVDVEFTVNGIPIDDGLGKELVARFQTSINNMATDNAKQTVCFTDSNGREMMLRQQDTRVDFPLVQTEAVAGNYYPVDALAYLKDDVAQFNIFTDAGMGGGSINRGEFYLTVHRRLLVDDHRGVTEPLNETEYVTSYAGCDPIDQNWCGLHYGPPLIVRGRLTLSIESNSDNAIPMRRTREIQDEKYFSPLVLFSTTQFTQVAGNMSLLQSALDSSLQLLTLQMLDSQTIILRLSHRYGISEDAARAVPVTVSLQGLLALPSSVVITSIDEVSLMTTEVITENVVTTTIGPMDVKSFVVHLQSL